MKVSLNHSYNKKIAFPTYEPKTTKWALNHIKEDWICFDCGANIGYYTIIFSKCAPKGRVYAFEPTNTHTMLTQNCAENGCENVEFINEALGNKNGVFKEKVYKIWGKPPVNKEFKFLTLDAFQEARKFDRIDLIKIDVDSFDYEVVEGAVNLLTELSPLVLVELNRALHLRNKKPKDVVNFMANINYENVKVLDENFLFRKK